MSTDSRSTADHGRGPSVLLMASVLVLGLLVSHGASDAMRRQAIVAWESESAQAVQALTGTLLGWLEESYAPVSALSVLFENSNDVTDIELLGAAEALESRSSASFLDSMAVIRPVAGDRWQVSGSNDPFGPLPRGASFAPGSAILATVQAAVTRAGSHVLGPPFESENGYRYQGAALAVESPAGEQVVVVGLLRFDELVTGLFDVFGLEAAGVAIDGRFLENAGTGPRRPLVDIPLSPTRLVIPARSVSGGAELFFDWRIGPQALGGVRDDAADFALVTGVVATLLLTWFIGFLLRQNRIISARIRAATRELAESEAQFRIFYDLNLVGLTLTSPETGWLRVNEYLCALLEYTEAQLMELDWARLTHPDDLAADRSCFQRMADGEIDGYELEKRLIARSGQAIPIRMVVRCVRKSDGSIDFVAAMIDDIRDTKAAEEALRSARDLAERARDQAEQNTRAKSAFLANMSHELRTPLNAIIGYSEMLAEELEEQSLESLLPDVHKVRSAGMHLLALINDILDLSKIEAGRMDLFLERFDLEVMLRESAATVQPLMDAHALRFTMQLGDGLGTVRADLTKLRQVLFNLLSNAAKFTHEGGVALSAERVDLKGTPWIRLAVQDSGIGIEPEQMNRVFEEFTQADVSTTREYGGTGLGLTISLRFCQMMGGDISVSSTPGVGSTFTIEIPAVVDALEAARASQTRVATTATAIEGEDENPDGELVLVIEDDPDARELLTRTMVRDGYRVAQAGDGDTGLKLAAQLLPAVITLDVMMPGVDGWTVLRSLKSDEHLRAIPVVMISMIADKGMGRALGADDYLVKPVDKELLLRSVGRYAQADGAEVLVVEDDLPTRELIRRNLEQRNLNVREAENGQRALDRLAESTPDLIVLDLLMPVMDGFEFLTRLRAQDLPARIPVIVLTAKVLTDAERRELADNAQGVLSKDQRWIESVTEEIRKMLRKEHAPAR